MPRARTEAAPPLGVVPLALREADALLRRVVDVARLLPALTAQNGAEERARLVASLEAGEAPSPAWHLRRRRVAPELFRCLEAARLRAEGTPLELHYQARVEELELELAMIEVLGEPKRVRPIAARRFGTGRDEVPLEAARDLLAGRAAASLEGLDRRSRWPPAPLSPAGGAREGEPRTIALRDIAHAVLATVEHDAEPQVIPPHDPDGGPSLTRMMLAVARAAGLSIDIKVDPRLSAGAATGDRTVFLADRCFGARESVRFAVHEVLGHAVAAANALDQPIRLFELGTAGSFAVQEGVAVFLEEQAGVLDDYRLRVLAARVLAADRMHSGARFGETARWLHREHGFSAADAIGLAERAYRGGGIARDVGYLRGWLEVRAAILARETSVDHLRAGRVGLDVARALPAIIATGLARPPRYRPSLALSLAATEAGTSCETSPPSVAASLTMFEET